MAAKQKRESVLRELRRRLGGISQEQFARLVGVTWSTVNRWENGKGRPSPLAREKLTRMLSENGLEDRLAELDKA